MNVTIAASLIYTLPVVSPVGYLTCPSMKALVVNSSSSSERMSSYTSAPICHTDVGPALYVLLLTYSGGAKSSVPVTDIIF